MLIDANEALEKLLADAASQHAAAARSVPGDLQCMSLSAD